jgi:hypothetical protein
VQKSMPDASTSRIYATNEQPYERSIGTKDFIIESDHDEGQLGATVPILKGFHPAHILHLFDHEILINKRCEFSHQTYSTPPTQSEQQSVNQWLHGYSLTSCNDRNTHSRYGTVLRLDLYTRCSVLTIPMRTVFICGESNHTDTLFTRNSYSITLHHKIHSWPGS